jgi:hypothetical protein
VAANDLLEELNNVPGDAQVWPWHDAILVLDTDDSSEQLIVEDWARVGDSDRRYKFEFRGRARHADTVGLEEQAKSLATLAMAAASHPGVMRSKRLSDVS